MDKKIVLKVGGSLLISEDLKLRKGTIAQFASILKHSSNVKAVIVGGGIFARKYISVARDFKADEALCDDFGIKVSRLNAQLLIAALGDKAFPKVIENLEEARIHQLNDRLLIAGGFVPGQSTTSVTFEIAEAIHATDVHILTDVDGIYNKDPDKFPDAEKYDDITIEELENVIYGEGGKKQSAAGEYRIFDAISIQIFKRSNMKVRLSNGENFEELRRILVEKDYSANIGTKIMH